MTGNSKSLTLKYQAELRDYLRQGSHAGLKRAHGLGCEAISLGLETLDLARIHEKALTTVVSIGDSPALQKKTIRTAGLFFAEALTPIEQTHRTAHESNVHLNRMIRSLSESSANLASSNRKLKQEIIQRKAVEESLRKSQQHYTKLLEQSGDMQKQLRLLSRQLLSAQEEERKKISRELHDVIAQTLTSINVQLATLKTKAALNMSGFDKSISQTQRLVEHSVRIVHQFARELRPTVLDDLGLIPALHTYLKNYTEETGIRVSLSAFAAIEQVTGDKRTVLYRVAQEALTNVARHARASQVHVKIERRNRSVRMRIKDNGNGFSRQATVGVEKSQRLGLLGMRERLQMVGGNFTITSYQGRGTTVLAEIPLVVRSRKRSRTSDDGAGPK
jgi:signal transduction histidine kinase